MLENISITYILGQLLLQWIFILRLKYALHGVLSAFAVSNRLFAVLYTLYFGSIVLIILGVFFTFLDENNKNNKQHYAIISTLLIILYLVFYFINYIILLRMFWIKNKQILSYNDDINTSKSGVITPKTADLLETSHKKNVKKQENINDHEIKHKKNDTCLIVDIDSINTLIRYTIAVYCGFFSSIIIWLFIVVFWAVFGTTSGHTGISLDDAIFSIDGAVNFVCICLLFEYAFIDMVYKKFCKPCTN